MDEQATIEELLSLNSAPIYSDDIELAIGRKLKGYHHPGSVYLNEKAMTIMTQFFLRNVKNFDYYGRNYLTTATISSLRDDIKDFRGRLAQA